MDLKLPLVITQPARRLVEAWVPGLPKVHKVGPGLSEIRDDLCLAVMELFEKSPVAELGAYQLPPHMVLRMIDVECTVHDEVTRHRWTLEGRLGVLIEKWPKDNFYIATPTRIPGARFAFHPLDELEHCLSRRIAAWAREHKIKSLKGFSNERRERLDILEVDADPPSLFPKGWHRFHVPGRKRRDPNDKTKDPSREEKRRLRRYTVRVLREIGRNLAHGARDDSIERAFGREAIVGPLVDDFELREGHAVVLVGPAGAGKTAIVHELVRRLVQRQNAAGTRRDVWRVDGNRFIAGMMYVGQWEARARELIEELIDLGDVLYIDDLASMVYAGRTRSGDTNVARFLEPHMARGELTVIAETTPERFERVREEEPTFASLFRVVPVEPLDDRSTLPVLLGALRDLEADAIEGAPALRVSPDALEAVLSLTRRFLAHEAFPGKAMRLLRSVLAGAGELRVNHRWYSRADVFATFQRQTGLPDFILGSGAHKSYDEVLRGINAMVVGQPEATQAVADVVVLMQHGLADPEKPLATYLFVGPTGVGKTETAKALATWLFGDASRMVRFDMSEFGSSVSITRLVGHADAPDGELTLALRTQPFCVVLFDEIEKAHPRVFDALLQLLGEGRLTDAAGRLADARQAVVIMTSNLGVKEASARTGFVRDGDDARAHYTAAVRNFFRPEFFNRIDRVVPFGPLSPEALRVVVEHALSALLTRRGVTRGNVIVDVEPELLDALVEQAYDPRYGARPLRRALERELAVPLAHHLVRRQSNDLCMVDVFRGVAGLSLTVRSMRNAPPVSTVLDASQWTAADTTRRLRELHERVDAMGESEAYERLADERADALAALQRGREIPPSPGIELLERLAELRDAIARVEEYDPSSELYVEEISQPSKRVSQATRHSWRTPQHSRIPPTFKLIATQANEGAVQHHMTPEVLRLTEGLEVLEHQVACSIDGVDRLTLLVEPTPSRAPALRAAAAQQVLSALPPFAGRMVHWCEVDDDDGVRWVLAREAGQRTVQRRAVSVVGAGARAVIGHLVGYALLTVRGIAGAIDESVVLVTIELLEGDDVTTIVAARDVEATMAREKRREGRSTVPDVATVTLRGHIDLESKESSLEHVATGLPAEKTESICAAMLRAQRA